MRPSYYCRDVDLSRLFFQWVKFLKHRCDKSTSLQSDILKQLELDPDTWVEEMKQFRTNGITAVGTVSQLKAFSLNVKKKWAVGFKIPALE